MPQRGCFALAAARYASARHPLSFGTGVKVRRVADACRAAASRASLRSDAHRRFHAVGGLRRQIERDADAFVVDLGGSHAVARPTAEHRELPGRGGQFGLLHIDWPLLRDPHIDE